MKSVLILLFICSYLSQRCDAQGMEQGVISRQKGKKTAVKTIKPQPKLPGKGTVSISTNEECTLLLNAKNYGSIKKGETKKIFLAYGTYKLIATNQATTDQYQDELVVKDNNSMVQIDLTALIARRRRQADSINSIKQQAETVATAASNSGRAAVTDSTAGSRATINRFLANMVAVPGGSFVMGNDLGDNDEGPEHPVNIRAVQFGKYEVTQQQWETVMGTNPSANPECRHCPVENISFEDVQAFLAKINRPGSVSFRLPTEAEWEYVAGKGGDARNMKDKAWYKSNAEGMPHAVGTKTPNSLGIYDMAGNVAEWCSDWYAVSYYKKKTADNPAGPDSGKYKVVRGGSFDDSENTLRRSYRDKQPVSSKKGTVGLRLVTEVK